MESTVTRRTPKALTRLAPVEAVRSHPAASDGVSYSLPAVTAEQVREVRHAITAYCVADAPGSDSHTAEIDAVALVVGELLANAGRHTLGRAHLVVASEPAHWVVLVFDTSGRPPAVDATEPGRKPSGLGLHLVEHLTDRWGSFPTQDGKVVWAHCPKPVA